jgi:tRNA pseudouridine65 synthase
MSCSDPAAETPAAEASASEAPVAALDLLYCDEQIAVVDKPAGLMVHDSKLARGEDDFLADRLRAQLGRPIFLVHRLDRATSGCLLLAFDRDSASALGKALMAGEIGKDYLTVCRGWPAEAAFRVDHDLDGGPGKPVKKPAVTDFQRLATGELEVPSTGFATSRYALLRCQPQTGRFRQIRRHLKHLSHHLIGDTSHGDGRHNRTFRMLGVHRMLLHAERLRFPHPADGRPLQVSAPLDAQFRKAFGLFGWDPDALPG